MKKTITSEKIMKPAGPYSPALETEKFVYISGQIGIDPNTNELVGDISAQTHRAMQNAQELCKEVGYSFDDIVKVTVLVDDINNMPIVNEIYQEYFKEPFPARMGYQVAALPRNAAIEIEFLIEK